MMNAIFCLKGLSLLSGAETIREILRFFETFIKERSMYYVCSNIVKPLTEPFQLSFVEMIGPTGIQWFVSHYQISRMQRHHNDY